MQTKKSKNVHIKYTKKKEKTKLKCDLVDNDHHRVYQDDRQKL